MGKRLLTYELCEAIEPLLPKELPKKPKGRRPRLPYQAALAGIIYRAQQQQERYPLWQMLPRQMGCGSASTCSGGACMTKRRPGCCGES